MPKTDTTGKANTAPTPPDGAIVGTEGDDLRATDGYAGVDGTVELDVLANEYLEGGAPGEGLSISALLDMQIDLDNDGVNDLDPVPDGLGEVTVGASDLDADGRLKIANATEVCQFNVIAGTGDDFLVDDIVLL